MTKQACLVCLVSALLAASTGCCELRMLCGPCAGIAVCDPANCCDATCGPECGPACGGACGAECATECDPCGEVCADPCCDPCCQPWGPLSWLFAVFTSGYCGDGCGELYWSDFHSEPPDCCDPCDQYGCWTGRGMGGNFACQNGQCGEQIARRGRGTTNRRVASAERVLAEGAVGKTASSGQAPRIISVTDRAVSPTPAVPIPVRQASQPTLAPTKR